MIKPIQVEKRSKKVVNLADKQLEREHLQALLTRVAEDRCRKSFSELFAHFSPLLTSFSYANPYSNSPAQFADDLVQEVMIKIWNKAASYNPQYAAVSTWVFTIARNTRIDMIRKNSRHDFPLDSDDMFDFEDEDTPELFQQVQQKQYEKELRKNLSLLPNEQAQVVAKVYLEGKSHSEVSQELSLPLGTVKSRVRLALSKLKVMVTH